MGRTHSKSQDQEHVPPPDVDEILGEIFISCFRLQIMDL